MASLEARRFSRQVQTLGQPVGATKGSVTRYRNWVATAKRAAADCGEAGEAVGQSRCLSATTDENSGPAQALPPICPRRRLLRPAHRRLARTESKQQPATRHKRGC